MFVLGHIGHINHDVGFLFVLLGGLWCSMMYIFEENHVLQFPFFETICFMFMSLSIYNVLWCIWWSIVTEGPWRSVYNVNHVHYLIHDAHFVIISVMRTFLFLWHTQVCTHTCTYFYVCEIYKHTHKHTHAHVPTSTLETRYQIRHTRAHIAIHVPRESNLCWAECVTDTYTFFYIQEYMYYIYIHL